MWTQARMTQIISNAERLGELPPLCLSPADLPGSPVSELQAAFALSRLVETLVYRIFKDELWHISNKVGMYHDDWFGEEGGGHGPEDLDRMPGLCVRMQRTLYRRYGMRKRK
ncbi:hypothetical protein N0V88_001160 [Collariella sp. IMI 366227]|nr:hypothetical protein N0V88_001160 [Collariella sp. IMI 366227]